MAKAYGTPEQAEKAFWSRVNRNGPNGCWVWEGYTVKGYGRFSFDGEQRANRQAYRFVYGSIPEGMHICHTCDNPSCVNPAHLYAGTRSDNMQDRAQKPGGRVRLTEDDIRKIRQLHKQGVTYPALASMFEVRRDWIGKICRRKAWEWVE